MKEVNAAAVVSELGMTIMLGEGDVPLGAVLLVLVGNANDGEPALERTISDGLSYWETLGIVANTLEDLKDSGRDA